MVGLEDGLGAGDPVGVLEQGDDVKRAGFFYRIVEARQRADVDHGIVPNPHRVVPEAAICPLIWRRILTRKRRLYLGLILGKRTHVAFLPKCCELARNARNTPLRGALPTTGVGISRRRDWRSVRDSAVRRSPPARA